MKSRAMLSENDRAPSTIIPQDVVSDDDATGSYHYSILRRLLSNLPGRGSEKRVGICSSCGNRQQV